MNFHTLRNLIKRGDITPVYYFYGKEKLLSEILSEEIIKKKIPPEERAHSVFKFELKETSWEEIVNLLSTASFFSKSKVVIVKVGSTSKKKEKNESNKAIVFVKEYLSSPSKNNYLIVIGEEKDKELFEIFKGFPSCTIFYMEHLKPEETQILIEEKLRENGKSISPSAMAVLVEEAQENFGIALKDLEKILVYSGDKNRIEKEELESLIYFSGRFRIDELIKVMDTRDKFSAFKILEDIMDNYEPVFVIGILASVFCRRYNNLLGEESQIRLRSYPSQEKRDKDIKAFHKKIKRTEHILEIIFDADIRIKSNPFNKGILEDMIAKIIEGEGLLDYEGI